MAPLSHRRRHGLLNGTKAHIVVGSEATRADFYVPRGILSHYSVLLNEHLANGMTLIEFKNGDPKIMKYVLEYMCRGYLGTVPSEPSPSWNLLRVYFLAEKLQVADIRPEVMNRLAAELTSDPRALGIEELRYIYNNFDERTPIRKLAAKWPAYAVLQKLVNPPEYHTLITEISKFALDLVEGVRDGHLAWMRGRHFYVDPTCQYHEYSDPRFCGYGNRVAESSKIDTVITGNDGGTAGRSRGNPGRSRTFRRRRHRNYGDLINTDEAVVDQPAMPASTASTHVEVQ